MYTRIFFCLLALCLTLVKDALWAADDCVDIESQEETPPIPSSAYPPILRSFLERPEGARPDMNKQMDRIQQAILSENLLALRILVGECPGLLQASSLPNKTQRHADLLRFAYQKENQTIFRWLLENGISVSISFNLSTPANSQGDKQPALYHALKRGQQDWIRMLFPFVYARNKAHASREAIALMESIQTKLLGHDPLFSDDWNELLDELSFVSLGQGPLIQALEPLARPLQVGDAPIKVRLQVLGSDGVPVSRGVGSVALQQRVDPSGQNYPVLDLRIYNKEPIY